MDYLLGDTLYESAETRVVAGVDRNTGEQVALKLPVGTAATMKTVDKLRHEHALLGELAAVPGIVRVRSLDPYGQGIALVPSATSCNRQKHGNPRSRGNKPCIVMPSSARCRSARPCL